MGAEYLPLIRSLMELDAPIRIFGGFAEDALLGGRIRRHHDDVDVMIARDALDRGLRMFEELGFAPPEIRFEPTAGSPLVMGTVREGLNLELSVIDIAEAGPPSFTLPGEHGLVRVLLPPDTWSWPPCELEGIVVRTISPWRCTRSARGSRSSEPWARRGRRTSRPSRRCVSASSRTNRKVPWSR